MRPAVLRLRLTWTFALVAWFAQLCLPIAHAAMQTTSSHGPMAAWCGSPANALEAAASLPAEIHDALSVDDSSIDADHLAHCAQLCAVGTTPAPLAATLKADPPQVAGSNLSPAPQTPFVLRRHALPPPSHGPPARA